MIPLVLDTDVASAVLKERVPAGLTRQLAGRALATTFVTAGELSRWTLVRHWGPRRTAGLHRFFASIVVLTYSPTVATLWGELQAHAQLRGRPRPINDTWVAACCLARELPSHHAQHEGLHRLRRARRPRTRPLTIFVVE